MQVLEYAERVGLVVHQALLTVRIRVHQTPPRPGDQPCCDLIPSDLLASQQLGKAPHRFDHQLAALHGAELDDLGQDAGRNGLIV